MLLTEDQRREYEERGFIVLRDVPEIAPLTERMVEVYQSVAEATPSGRTPRRRRTSSARRPSCPAATGPSSITRCPSCV